MKIVELTIEHYDSMLELMQQISNVTVREPYPQEAITRHLKRNPGMSFVAIDGNRAIAYAVCGHDGKCGYLQHIFVSPPYRKLGIALQLVERCLSKLESLGIFKTDIDVFADNDFANEYWVKNS